MNDGFADRSLNHLGTSPRTVQCTGGNTGARVYKDLPEKTSHFHADHGIRSLGNLASDIAMRKAFTLVEILIVALIIAMLLMIAVPAWRKIRDTSREKSCWDQIRIIEDAKVQWALDTHATATAVPTMADLSPSYIRKEPECPTHGTYTVGDMGTKATCSDHGSGY